MSNLKRLVTQKWFIIGGSGLILLLIIVQIRQYRVRHGVNKEISELSGQVEKLQKSNADLQNMIAYLQTDSYKQKAAREQLSMRKEGETVYSFSELEKQEQAYAQAAAEQQRNKSNISKWWQYFFNN